MRTGCAVLFACLMIVPRALFSQEVSEDFATPQSEDMVAKMDMLIAATEKGLMRQKEIRKLLVEYKEVEKKAILDPDNTDNLLKLMGLAKELHESIKNSYLDEYFPPQFLQELDKLSALYDKKNIPPAK